MLRRLISGMAITAAAVLAPAAVAAADDGYEPGEPSCTISFESLTTPVGEPLGFTIECTEDLANRDVNLQIAPEGEAAAADQAVEVAGADSTQYTLDDDATASDTATFSAPGDYTFQVWSTDGEPLSVVYTITAFAPGADDDDGGLAVTGSTSLPYLAAAGILLLLGVGAIVATRVQARRT